MAEMCTNSSDDVKTEDGLRYTEKRESGHQSMVGVEFDSTFGTQSWREDAALVVEEKRIYVSRGVLSLLSSVFTQMFEEKINHSGPMEIQLEGIKHWDMIEFLKCIYPNIMKDVTLENVFVVLPLALKFGIDPLKQQCEDLLLDYIDDYTDLQDICMYLGKAFEFNLTRLKNECIDIASNKDYSDLKEVEKEFPLPVEAKLEIQGKMIEKMEQQMLEENNSPLKKAIKAVKLEKLLVGSVDVSKLKNPHVGYLEYTFSEFNKKSHRSPPTTVHGITWCIQVQTTKPENFGLFLEAKQFDSLPKWNCQAGATFCLFNYKNDEASIRRTTDRVFTESENCWGYSKIADMSNVIDPNEGFIKDGKVQVDICFLVGEPTFE